MINGDMVVAQALQGAVPPTWRVLRAKTSFFYSQIGLAIFLMLLGGGVFFLLIGDPNTAYGYGLSDSSSLGEFNFWRTADFVVAALVALAGVYYLVKNVLDMTHIKEQALVLLPEGFVINSDKRVAYAYAAMRTLSVTINRGTVNIKIFPANGGKTVTLALDARFGNAKQIAQMIATARNQFAAAQVNAPQPQPMAYPPNPQA